MRVFHTDSRTFANFQPAELGKLCGVPRARWAEYVLKELFDNACAVVEELSERPQVWVVVSKDEIRVSDSGPGISDAILDKILDFTAFGGSNRHHKLPTRGAQGNAIMTVFGIASVWNAEVCLGRPCGDELRMKIILDPVLQKVDIERTVLGGPCRSYISIDVTTDTYTRSSNPEVVAEMAHRLAGLNPHITTSVRTVLGHRVLPSQPTARPCISGNPRAGAASWFTPQDYADRLAADVRARPDVTVAEWQAEFMGRRPMTGMLAGMAIGEVAPSDKEGLLKLASRWRDASIASGSSVDDPKFAGLGQARCGHLLAEMGGDPEAGVEYAIKSGTFQREGATIPFLAEVALLQLPPKAKMAPEPFIAMNRTVLYGSPSKMEMHWREKVRGAYHPVHGDIGALTSAYQIQSGDTPCAVMVHVVCPSPGYAGYGKQQFDTSWLQEPLSEMMEAVTLKVRRQRAGEARRTTGKNKDRSSIRDELFALLPVVLRDNTDGGREPILLRQLYYATRKEWYVLDDRKLHYATFCAYIDEFERNVVGKAVCLKDPRGTLYEPHSGRNVVLGTAMMDKFEPKKWEGHTIIFIEKENLASLMVRHGIGKRYDAIIIGSKGFAVEAAREALQKYKKLLGNLVKIVCLHDADPAGYMIGHDLATSLPRFGDNVDVQVIDVGLTMDEARRMKLQDEPFELKKPVWSMIRNMRKLERTDGRSLLEPAAWDSFMPLRMRRDEFPGEGEGRRVELNAIPPMEFAGWVCSKLDEHNCAKVRPPEDVVEERLRQSRLNAISNQTGHLFMRMMGERLVARVQQELGLPEHGLDAALASKPEQHWEYLVDQAAKRGDQIEKAVERAMREMAPGLFDA